MNHPLWRATLVASIVLAASTAAAADTIHVPEGTELDIQFEDSLSSKTNTEGDRFTISLADDVKLPGGAVIPAGYRGVGEVTSAEKNGMMGRGGTLNVRFDYLKVGDARIRVRGSKGNDGKDSTGSVVALTVLFGPIGLIKKGHNAEIRKGQHVTAYVDEDVDLPAPLAPPPKPE